MSDKFIFNIAPGPETVIYKVSPFAAAAIVCVANNGPGEVKVIDKGGTGANNTVLPTQNSVCIQASGAAIELQNGASATGYFSVTPVPYHPPPEKE